MKPKLAIISTYDELCGIAGYTKALVPNLEAIFDVTVFDLDQFLLRTPGKRMRALGDQEIKKICTNLQDFEYVNIQLEHGTLGGTTTDIYRRFKMLVEASRNCAITLHTILPQENFSLTQVFSHLRTFSLSKAIAYTFDGTRPLNNKINKLLQKNQKKKNISIITHTKRDHRLYNIAYGIKNVFNHPLAFYSKEQREEIRLSATRDSFGILKSIPSNAKILGCFGFLGEYKGLDTAIKALSMLPEDYHLVIFGGLHPNAIKKGVKINPYIESILDEIAPRQSLIESISTENTHLNLSLNCNDLIQLQTIRNKKDLSDRVHFAGAVSDADFASSMCICDIVLLPYLEVGQSSSGPMSIALEMGSKIIASRTKAFMQYARYHPEHFEMFEQGNYVQLAQLIATSTSTNPIAYPDNFNVKTNINTYCAALGYGSKK